MMGAPPDTTPTLNVHSSAVAGGSVPIVLAGGEGGGKAEAIELGGGGSEPIVLGAASGPVSSMLVDVGGGEGGGHGGKAATHIDGGENNSTQSKMAGNTASPS